MNHHDLYTVLDLVIPYTTQRTQARMRTVCKDIKALVPSTVTPPVYSDLIQELVDWTEKAVKKPHTKYNKTTLSMDQEGYDVEYGLHCRIEGKVILTGSRGIWNAGPWVDEDDVYGMHDDDDWIKSSRMFRILVCEASQVKRFLYRALERRDKGIQKYCGIPLSEFLNELSSAEQ